MPSTVGTSQVWLIACLSQTHLTSSKATALKADVISQTRSWFKPGFLTRSPVVELLYSTAPNLSDFLWSLFYLIAIVCQASQLQTAPIPCPSSETLSGPSDGQSHFSPFVTVSTGSIPHPDLQPPTV